MRFFTRRLIESWEGISDSGYSEIPRRGGVLGWGIIGTVGSGRVEELVFDN